MSGYMPWDSVFDLIKTGIDKIWPDKTEADKAKAALAQAELQGALKEMEVQWENANAQIKVNEQEAASTNIFVAGWRPFVGWVCGSAFAWTFVLQPIVVTVFAAVGHPIDQNQLPKLDFSQIQPVLYGLLGLGAMRTYEKLKKATSQSNM
ncbi:holin family protein [Aeromonas sp. BC14]|uniref:holin family protein n=1 Tax=Aeromonas TaxID=642 RepID=UPI00227BC554|nr:holin family protein [Aeromonas sp. BC14]WAF93127.1 holin family protein [Aeromonas sp. BC14]